MTTRLEKLLGMLGSDFDGERANAALMISNMAKAAGKTIAEFVIQGGEPQIVYREKIVYRETPVYRYTPDPPDMGDERFYEAGGTLLESLRNALQHAIRLSQWEVDFATDMAHRYYSDDQLTKRQVQIAERIIRKVNKHDAEAPI